MASEELFVMTLPTTTLVFGLQWLPLLGGKVERLGARMARQHRATHMVLADDTAGSVGIATLKPGRIPRKLCLHSAAQNIAQLFSTGTIAVLLQLEHAGFWLVAVHEGAVVARTDRLFPSSADAQLVLSELRLAYPQLVLLGDAQAPATPSLGAIEAASSHHSSLRLLRRWSPILPWPVQVFLLSLVLVLLVPRLWDMLRPVSQGPAKQMGDPAQAWRLALEKAIQDRHVHGVAGTRSLLETLHQLPIRVGGWTLKEAECTPQARKWRCQARYERSTVHASNSQFLAGAPPHWIVEFASIEQARPAWEANAYGVPLDAGNLKSSAHNERDLFSSLQAIRTAFSQMRIGQPTPLSVPAPTDGHGRALPRPPGLTTYLSRPVQFSGPLRSSSLMLPYTGSIAWNKALLTLRDVDKPGLKKSSLSLSLQGVLYETEVLAGHSPHTAIVSDDSPDDPGETLY